MGLRDTIKITYEEYKLIPDDGRRHEIIEGELYMTPAPKVSHQAISKRIEEILLRIEKKGLGKVFNAPIDVVLSDTDIVQPDLIFILNENISIIGEDNIHGAPDMVIEIISPGTRRIDKLLKRKLYEKFGVKEYWMIDHEIDCVEQFILEDKGYKKRGEYYSGKADSITIEGFEIDLAELFKRPLH